MKSLLLDPKWLWVASGRRGGNHSGNSKLRSTGRESGGSSKSCSDSSSRSSSSNSSSSRSSSSNSSSSSSSSSGSSSNSSDRELMKNGWSTGGGNDCSALSRNLLGVCSLLFFFPGPFLLPVSLGLVIFPHEMERTTRTFFLSGRKRRCGAGDRRRPEWDRHGALL